MSPPPLGDILHETLVLRATGTEITDHTGGQDPRLARKEKPTMPPFEHIEAIEKRLWSAADTLRANSNHASNECFMPVMGLIFLRHA